MTGYRDDIHSQPDEFEGAFDSTAAALAAVLTPDVCKGLTEIVLAGCGDSHHAGVASALAFEHFTSLRTRPLTSMQLSRYETSIPLDGSLVIAVSVSGQTARTVEAAVLAQAAGAVTLGVSSRPGSRLATSADHFVASAVPPADVHGPDARTYMSSLLVLFLAAIQVGESRGALTAEKAADARARLRATSELMRETIALCEPHAEAAAVALVAEGFDAIMAIGAGPSFGVALFAAAKVVEAAGTHAWAQDGEEWAHLEYWLADERMPTIIVAADGRSTDRLEEQLDSMTRIGRRTIAIAPTSSPILEKAAYALPVSAIEEIFSPLIYALTVELLSFYLVKEADLPFYAVTRDDQSEGPSNAIRSGLSADKLEQLKSSVGGREAVR